MSEHTPHTVDYPGYTRDMAEEPHDEMRAYRGRDLLAGKKALVTGGDSGIGRAVAVAFAKEGADVAIAYLEEGEDAAHTATLVQNEGRHCRTYEGDLASPDHCRDVVERTVSERGSLDIVVNNFAYQQPVDDFLELSSEQWRRTSPPPGFLGDQHRVGQRPTGQQVTDRLLRHKGRCDRADVLTGAGVARPRDPGELRCAGTGMETAHTGHDGQGGGLRYTGAIWTRRSAGRDRPLVRVLRFRTALVLLFGRSAGTSRW